MLESNMSWYVIACKANIAATTKTTMTSTTHLCIYRIMAVGVTVIGNTFLTLLAATVLIYGP